MDNETIREEIKKLRKYEAGKREEDVEKLARTKKIIKLSSNENNYRAPPGVVRAIIKALRDINRYPEIECRELKKAISEYIALPEENISIGNGSDEILECCFKIFINKGDRVAILFPSFSYYYILSQIYGAEVRKIELDEKGNEFKLNMKNFEKAVKGARMIILASPNNPTGNAINREEFEKIMQSLNEKKQVLIIDEAYAEFNELSFAKDVLSSNNLVITRTFSKAFALAALRIGYACSAEEIASYIERVKQPFSVSLLSQVAALEALRRYDYARACIKKIKKERERMLRELRKIHELKAFDSKANFILIKTERKASKEVFKKLAERGIIVRECSNFGINNYIRATIGKRNENSAFLKAIKEVMQD